MENQTPTYFVIGKGEKDLILLPGLSFFPLYGFKDFISARYEDFLNDYKIHVIDRILNPQNDYTLFDAAREVVKIINENIKADFDIIGISQGGMIAQIVALDNVCANLKSLVLCSTTPVVNDDIRSALSIWRDASYTKNAKLLGEAFCKLVYTPDVARNAIDNTVESIKKSPDALFERFVKLIDACNNFDITPQLHKIVSRTLVLSSLGDKIINPLTTRPLFEKIKDVAFIDYPKNTSHAIYDEEDSFIQNVLSFLGLNR